MTAPAPARLDSGNRALTLLLVMVLGFRGVLMTVACCAVCVVAARVWTTGLAGLWAGGWRMPGLVVLAALLLASTGTALVRLARELRADHALRREVRSRGGTPDVDLDRIVAPDGLSGRVDVVRAAEPFAFTYGLVVPRVAVSSGLVRTATAAELAAILVHESAHARGRDPLKILAARVLVAREFYLPVLRHLSVRFVAGRELAADRRAITHCGTQPVASALLRVLSPPAWATASPAAAMAGAPTLDARITQLETGNEPPLPPMPRRSWLASAAIAATVLGVAASGSVVIQQMCMATM